MVAVRSLGKGTKEVDWKGELGKELGKGIWEREKMSWGLGKGTGKGLGELVFAGHRTSFWVNKRCSGWCVNSFTATDRTLKVKNA